MKKIKMMLMLAAAILAALASGPAAFAAGEMEDAVTRETRVYDYRNFDGIEANWLYRVELTQSREYAVRIEAPDYVMPYLEVRQKGSMLRMDITSMPRDIRRMIERGNHAIVAYVSMPALSELRLSGACRVNAEGAFSSGDKTFHLVMSGATKVQGLDISARKAEIDASGAAAFTATAAFISLDADFSGAVNCVLEGNVGDAEIQLSGASFFRLSGDLGAANVGVSGASGFTLEGAADELSADASGASKVFAETAPVGKARIELSGASVCRIDVEKQLTVDLSGASKCRYRGPESLNVNAISIARSATLTRL